MNSNNNDDELFRAFVNDVSPLEPQTVEPSHDKPKAHVKKQPCLTTSSFSPNTKNHHDSDTFFAFHLSKKVRKNFKAGKIYFDATLDLHGQTVSQSEQLMLQFINDCRLQHIKNVIIIHGQGHNSEHGSVLKPAVLYWLSQQDIIEAYCPAQSRDGGHGASYVLIAE